MRESHRRLPVRRDRSATREIPSSGSMWNGRSHATTNRARESGNMSPESDTQARAVFTPTGRWRDGGVEPSMRRIRFLPEEGSDLAEVLVDVEDDLEVGSSTGVVDDEIEGAEATS